MACLLSQFPYTHLCGKLGGKVPNIFPSLNELHKNADAPSPRQVLREGGAPFIKSRVDSCSVPPQLLLTVHALELKLLEL
jgi:hypothetical protein